MRLKHLTLAILTLALIVAPATAQVIVTTHGIPVGTTRGDGSAHQAGDSLFWSATYGRWIAGAPTSAAWGGITGTITGQTEFTGLSSTGMVITPRSRLVITPRSRLVITPR